MNVKERRIDLRWKMAEEQPWEIEEVCKTILQEREILMKEKTRDLLKNLCDILTDGYEKFKPLYPDVYERFLKAMDVYNAQAIRWVYDECSPVEWTDSDAYAAASSLGQIAMESATLEVR